MKVSTRIPRVLRHFISRLVCNTWLVLILVLTVAPIAYLCLTSIKPPRVLFEIPPRFVFRPDFSSYYQAFITRGHLVYFVNSAIIVTASTVLTLVLGSMLAFAFSNFRFRGSKLLFYVVLLTRTYPPVTTLIPIYFMITRLGLFDTKIGLILVYVGFEIPLVTLCLRVFFSEVPKAIQESAVIDGCSMLQVFYRIVLPLSSPGIVAAGVLIFILNWNEFMFALTLTSFEAKTAPVALMAFMETESRVHWGVIAALGTATMTPVLVFSLLFGRFLVRGLTLGALKG